MEREDLDGIFDELAGALAERPGSRIAVVGRTAAAIRAVAHVRALGDLCTLTGMYAPADGGVAGDGFAPLERLSLDGPDIVVVAADAGKEALLQGVSDHVVPETRILIGGYGHLEFDDPTFRQIVGDALVPSLANGYPNCLIHLYQCIRAAARLKLGGVVAEFGMFRGGTTMLLSRFVEAAGMDWKVIGFDTFDGFPPKRSPLDLYAHRDCVFRNEAAVRRYLAGRDVEVVPGDVVSTVARLAHETVVLAFVDTDNHTSANAILDVVAERVAVGGAIVFDHWAGRRRHLYTIGERMAAGRLARDPRYMNLHDTGVFVRIAQGDAP